MTDPEPSTPAAPAPEVAEPEPSAPAAPAPNPATAEPVRSGSAPIRSSGKGGRPSGRGTRRSDGPRAVDPLNLDDETKAQLHRFNEYQAQAKAADARAKKVRKAITDKDRAADRVKQVNQDPKATKEAKAEAEAAYKEAVEVVRRLEAASDADREPVEADESAANEPDPDGEDSAGRESAGRDEAVGEPDPAGSAPTS